MIVPSFSEYVLDVFRRFKQIKFGFAFWDRFNLFCIGVVDSVPNCVLNAVLPNGLIKRSCHGIASRTSLKIEGLKIGVSDFTGLCIMTDDSEEFMRHYFNPKICDVVVDVGAHIGKYSVPWAMKVGSFGCVLSIEPKRSNFLLLESNIRKNDLSNVHIFNVAAWNKFESLTLNVGESSAQVSSHFPLKNKITVQAVPLDYILSNFLRVDWVKVDVEGAEKEVLEGLMETLKRCKPKLMLEVWNFNYDQVKAILINLGYRWLEVTQRSAWKYGDDWFVQVYATPN